MRIQINSNLKRKKDAAALVLLNKEAKKKRKLEALSVQATDASVVKPDTKKAKTSKAEKVIK